MTIIAKLSAVVLLIIGIGIAGGPIISLGVTNLGGKGGLLIGIGIVVVLSGLLNLAMAYSKEREEGEVVE